MHGILNIKMKRSRDRLVFITGIPILVRRYIYIATDPILSQYRQTSNIIGTLVGNETADPSHVVGASPVGAAPTTSSFST